MSEEHGYRPSLLVVSGAKVVGAKRGHKPMITATGRTVKVKTIAPCWGRAGAWPGAMGFGVSAALARRDALARLAGVPRAEARFVGYPDPRDAGGVPNTNNRIRAPISGKRLPPVVTPAKSSVC